ncbi:MAG: mechanosensitive ion channel family protein [Anaerolineae bacterium]|jgi:miniconductance mechanosensitive channel|nr:mechanosensitive ion channel family protein [Anaerolineae bacterium]
MTIEGVGLWLEANPGLAPWVLVGVALALNAAVLLVARNLIARGLVYLTQRSKTKVDDILVRHMRPYRFAWLAPLLLTYYIATWVPAWTSALQALMLIAILWLVVVTFLGLFSAINVIYESGSAYRGVSIQSYLDLGKLLTIVVGVILTASQITGKSPVVLLSGLGAITALLVLIFHDTLLSFVASLQIQSHDLVREGDWIEMPAYEADGIIANVALHTVKVQNWDNTITVVPTHKLLDTPYRNWRGMTESGGRRIKRAIHVDLSSVAFCDSEMIERYRGIGLIRDYVEQRIASVAAGGGRDQACFGDVCAEHELTNVGAFRAYMTAYLRSRADVHQEGDMMILVRQLDPGPMGLPLEVYAFTKTTQWAQYEAIQAEIFEHLVAAAPAFGLRVFQQPTGTDFRALAAAV